MTRIGPKNTTGTGEACLTAGLLAGLRINCVLSYLNVRLPESDVPERKCIEVRFD